MIVFFRAGTAFALALLALSSAALAQGGCKGCSCRGGPGFRMPNGQCAGWATVARVCGVPHSTHCADERPPHVREGRDAGHDAPGILPGASLRNARPKAAPPPAPAGLPSAPTPAPQPSQ